jgi:hypothetical protein
MGIFDSDLKSTYIFFEFGLAYLTHWVSRLQTHRPLIFGLGQLPNGST